MDEKEIVCEYLNGLDHYSVSTNIRRYITKLEKYKKMYPEDVNIVYNRDGSVFATLNKEKFGFKIPSPKKQMSEESRKKMSERMKKFHSEKDEDYDTEDE